MTLNEMKNNVIRNFGFEHFATIYFFDWCEHEKDNLALIKEVYEDVMHWEEDDDEEW